MSRSNPTDNTPNPAVRWFEWNGEAGTVRYYDKDAKQNVDVGLPFAFMLLDELASVRGWHEPSQSGIVSNEVRDTRQDVLVVRAFKGGTLAEGFYKDIKDRVNTAGGSFVSSCYVAFKNGGEGLDIGNFRFKGAALGSWMEFRKANRRDLYKKAIEITGYTEGKKGRVTYRMPTFRLKELTAETDQMAVGLDMQLQEFLTAYLARTRVNQAEVSAEHVSHHPADDDYGAPPVDDIPFAWLLPLLTLGASALTSWA